MNDTFTLDEVSALLSTVLRSIRAGGGIEDGAYPLPEVASRTGFAPSSLLKDCRADKIEHVSYGDGRSMTPTQVAKFLARHSRGGDLAGQRPAAQDDMALARAASQRAATRRSPRRAA